MAVAILQQFYLTVSINSFKYYFLLIFSINSNFKAIFEKCVTLTFLHIPTGIKSTLAFITKSIQYFIVI